MIQTNNPELDAAFAELQGQLIVASEQNALKAGNIAGLRAEIEGLKKRIEGLESATKAEKEATSDAVQVGS